MTVLEALQDARARIESATRTLLVRARDRIANPAHWTQSFSARDCIGNAVSFIDEDAVCWCLTGALNLEEFLMSGGNLENGKFGTLETRHTAKQARQYIREAMYDLNLDAETPAHLNDDHDHATVMQAVNKAIEYADQIADQNRG